MIFVTLITDVYSSVAFSLCLQSHDIPDGDVDYVITGTESLLVLSSPFCGSVQYVQNEF